MSWEVTDRPDLGAGSFQVDLTALGATCTGTEHDLDDDSILDEGDVGGGLFEPRVSSGACDLVMSYVYTDPDIDTGDKNKGRGQEKFCDPQNPKHGNCAGFLPQSFQQCTNDNNGGSTLRIGVFCEDHVTATPKYLKITSNSDGTNVPPTFAHGCTTLPCVSTTGGEFPQIDVLDKKGNVIGTRTDVTGECSAFFPAQSLGGENLAAGQVFGHTKHFTGADCTGAEDPQSGGIGTCTAGTFDPTSGFNTDPRCNSGTDTATVSHRHVRFYGAPTNPGFFVHLGDGAATVDNTLNLKNCPDEGLVKLNIFAEEDGSFPMERIAGLDNSCTGSSADCDAQGVSDRSVAPKLTPFNEDTGDNRGDPGEDASIWHTTILKASATLDPVDNTTITSWKLFYKTCLDGFEAQKIDGVTEIIQAFSLVDPDDETIDFLLTGATTTGGGTRVHWEVFNHPTNQAGNP
jgi:hypothetical protein